MPLLSFADVKLCKPNIRHMVVLISDSNFMMNLELDRQHMYAICNLLRMCRPRCREWKYDYHQKISPKIL